MTACWSSAECVERGTLQEQLALSGNSPLTCDAATRPSVALPVTTKCKVCEIFSPYTIRVDASCSNPADCKNSLAAAPYGAIIGFAIARCLYVPFSSAARQLSPVNDLSADQKPAIQSRRSF